MAIKSCLTVDGQNDPTPILPHNVFEALVFEVDDTILLMEAEGKDVVKVKTWWEIFNKRHKEELNKNNG